MTGGNPLNARAFFFPVLMVMFMIFRVPCPLASDEACSSRQNICFKWTFVADVQKAKQLLPVNTMEKTVLHSGDRLHSSFTLTKPCFLYFVHVAKEEATLLYPAEVPQESPPDSKPFTFHIPGGGQWFVLDDNTGEETFYLLAASMRLKELEGLLMDHRASNASEKKELGKRIIKKMDTLQQKLGRLTASAERPVKIGGTVRGAVDQDSQYNAASLMVSANDFYIKVITIDHK